MIGVPRRGAVLLALCLLGAACGGDDDDDGASGEPGGEEPTEELAGEIVIGTTDSLQNSFDPAQAYDYFGGEVIQNTAETLVTYKPNATEPSPLLAAEMPEVSADGLTYTFKLREGIQFHDGTDLDAEAVKFSLERAQAFGAKDAEAAGFLLDPIESIEAPSPTEVVIKLKGANVTFLSRLAFSVASIVSPTAYKDHVLAGEEEGEAVSALYKADTIVGSGPYRLVEYLEDESLEFEANEDYWGDAPKTDRVLVRLFDKSSALKLALENEDVDIAFRSLQPDENSSFKDKKGFKLIQGEGPGIRYIVFNTTAKPWDDPNMRRALASGIDRQAIVDEVFKGTTKPLPSMIPDTFPVSKPVWTDKYGTGEAADAATRVGAALTAAKVPAGQKVPVDLWYSPTHYGDTEASVAEVIKRSLEATGRFQVKVSNVEWAEYGQKRRNGEMPVFLMGWYPDFLDPDNYLEPFSNPDSFDPAKWEDEAMLKLIADSQVEANPDTRAGILAQAQTRMGEETPYVPLFSITQFAATTDKISGVVLDPIQIFRYWLLEKRG
jgi:peptide/nickel transport system substrate-binding protein